MPLFAMQIRSTRADVGVCMCSPCSPSSSACASFQTLVMRGFALSTFKLPHLCVCMCEEGHEHRVNASKKS